MKHSYFIFFFLIILIGCSSEMKTTENHIDRKWWKEAIVYQIYPRSFKDTDGDGVGDLRGIIEKLDYIQSLGVDAVWLNPFFKSPNTDNGYDVSDYRAIQPKFGTMEDFYELLKGLHKRDIKFVIDMVVNHSSDEHEWFKQSRSSRDNPYRDYYHWWPAEKGKPNYRWSYFDEKANAWQYDSLTDAYYLHYFHKKQPDLKWENPKLRQEIYDIMKFWAEKGVDGFRLDAFQFVSKDTTFPALPEGYHTDNKQVIKYYGMGPNLHTYLRELHDEVLSKYDVFAVSEGAGSTFEDAHNLVNPERKELQMVYHFEGIDVSGVDGYDLGAFKTSFSRWDSAFAQKGWISIYLANHDNARLVSHFGNDSPEFREPSVKMLNTFLLSMRGTPYCYFGDEIGMTNIYFDSISQYKDVGALTTYDKIVSDGGDVDAYLKMLSKLNRDNSRTPMQWDTSPNAGFTTGVPWLPVNDKHKYINVVKQQDNPNSILNHFRKMVKIRKENLVLVYGTYELLAAEHPDIYAYTRTLKDKKMLVLLNFTDHGSSIELPEVRGISEILINNYDDMSNENGKVTLKPYQAVIVNLNKL